jgi:hypothetical protein
MSASSSSTDLDAPEDFVLALSRAERNAIFDSFSEYKQCDVLETSWKGEVETLPASLQSKYKALLVRRKAASRQRCEQLAIRQAGVFCKYDPELACHREHIRVYLKTKGEVQDERNEYGHTDDDKYENMFYTIKIKVLYKDKIVVRFLHEDRWIAETYDSDKVRVRHEGNLELTRKVEVPKGVPCTPHQWRVATRKYLRDITSYYEIKGRLRFTWHSSEEDSGGSASGAGSVSEGHDRKRQRVEPPLDSNQ